MNLDEIEAKYPDNDPIDIDVRALVAEVRRLNLQVDQMRKTLERLASAQGFIAIGVIPDDQWGNELRARMSYADEAITEKPKSEGGNPWAPNKDVPAPIRRGCICGPEGMCDYHRVTDTTTPRQD